MTPLGRKNCTNWVQNYKTLRAIIVSMDIATHENVKLVDKLPSVQALQKRIKLLEEQLKENESTEEK